MHYSIRIDVIGADIIGICEVFMCTVMFVLECEIALIFDF